MVALTLVSAMAGRSCLARWWRPMASVVISSSREQGARHSRAAAMAARCRELLAPLAEVVPGESTLVAFRDDDPPATVARLAEAGVVVREIPKTGLVRVSCGWWTDEDDLRRLIAAL